MRRFALVLTGLTTLSIWTGLSLAVDITLNKNGFPSLAGGQVTGPGLASAIPLGGDASPVRLTNLQSNGIYSVDFFHNSGLGSSDFSFTINATGTGVESVAPSSGGHTMVVGFTPGATNLTLNTHVITYNANSGQTGSYFLHGLTAAHTTPAGGSGPTNVTALPGSVHVDNLYNTGGGNEDFDFMVNSDGTVSAVTERRLAPGFSPGANNEGYAMIMTAEGRGVWFFTNAPSYEEYASFSGSSISPNATIVQFRVEASTNLGSIASAYVLPIRNPTNVVLEAGERRFVYEFDMKMTPGNCGLSFIDFGSNTVVSSTAMLSDNGDIRAAGPPMQGGASPDNCSFLPRLRYAKTPGPHSANSHFYWQNTDGPSNVAAAVVNGFLDGNTVPLSISVTATIRAQ